MRLKQSTAVALSFGPALDPTDGKTLVTTLVSALDNGSTGIKLSKNGGALTIRHASVTATTYDGYGNYIVTLDTTDTNTLGTMRMQFADASVTLPMWMDFEVVNANEWDSSFGTSVLKKVDVTQLLTTAWLTPGTAGTPDVNAKLWNGLATVALPLVPTTAGRTLDVSTTGEAGLDWANVGSPTTTVGLTGTTISSSQVVASVAGAVGSVAGAVGSVTGAVGSVTGAVGSVTGNVGGNVTGSVGSIATGGIATTSFAAGAIDAAAIATDAIGSAEFSAAASNKVADALLDRAAGVETGITPRQGLRVMLAASAGKLSGAATTTVAIRNTPDTVDRITATVDANGNRSAVTLDLT